MDDAAGLRREVDRLRAENVRLTRLLGMQGSESVPAPERLPDQAATPLAQPGMVTMASPVADKVALFTDRFRARTDVYALRWENSRTGTAGWMPAVAGGWRKGMDRRAVTHLPLTPDIVAAHLVGDVFLGLYPRTCCRSARSGPRMPRGTGQPARHRGSGRPLPGPNLRTRLPTRSPRSQDSPIVGLDSTRRRRTLRYG